MTKLSTKRLILATMVLATAFAAIGCKTTTTTTTTLTTVNVDDILKPALSNPDGLFFQGDGYEVTYNDFFEDFKRNDGINQLLFLVDEALFATYLASVTQAQIDEKILYLTYGMTDQEKIDQLTADEVQDFQDAYADNMFLLGYEADPEEYVRIICAKENFAVAEMIDVANAEETWYVGEEAVAEYYSESYYEDITAIKIRCMNLNDAKSLLALFNLVSYHTEIRLYTGTAPMASVYSFNDDNTRSLSNEELLSYFIQMYNYVYGGYRDLLPTDATIADLKAVEDLQIPYLTLYGIDSPLAGFLFGSLTALENNEEERSYTYAPFAGNVGTESYLMLKVADPNDLQDLSQFDAETQDLATLIGQETYDVIKERLIKTNKETSGTISSIICQYRTEHNFQILDYYMGLDYSQVDATFVPTTVGHSSIIASFDTTTITADQLLTYALNKNGALYTLYVSQMEIAMSRYFSQVYCVTDVGTCEFDVTKNASAKITEHEETLAKLQETFETSYYYYVDYGWETWLYLAYGAKSETDMIANYYVKSTLQPWIIYEGLQANDWAILRDVLVAKMQEYYDNYFNLFVETLSIYADRDENGVADEYEDFVGGLDDQVAYDALLVAFEADIREYLAVEDHTFSSLISDYKKASMTDATWGAYRAYGLFLGYENVSGSTAALTYVTALENKVDAALIDEIILTYQTYLLAENENLESLYSASMAQTATGVSLLMVKQGTDFERLSAQFENTKNANDEWIYAVGTTNASDVPSLDQLKLYCEYRFDQMVYGTDAKVVLETYGVTIPALPADLLTALTAYFADVHDSMYVIGFLNMMVADDMAIGTFTNATAAYCALTNAELLANLSRVRGIYDLQVFPEPENNE